VTPQLVPLANAAHLPFASTLCGACRDVCPVAIDIPALLLHLRQQVREGSATGRAAAPRLFERWSMRIAAFWLRGPRRYRFAAAIARFGDRWFGALLRRLPPLRQWTKGRTAPRLAQRDLRTLWRQRRKP
jgi:L-lactate dehydrogenase complex protein LldF